MTIGYFFIKEHLKLLDATASRAVANSLEPYGGVDVNTAMFLLLYLIDKWFNAPDDEDDKTVYKITNHIAQLIRDHTNLDGIIYRSTKNPNENCWNIALVNQNKVTHGYSELYVQDSIGRFRRVCIKKEKITITVWPILMN